MSSTKRELFKSPDVCEMAQLQPYVLRSWEAEFPSLGRPLPAGTGRVYRRADVELVLRIKQLVFGEGLTLAGARRRLEEDQSGPSVAVVSVDDVLGEMARTKLRQVRSGLESILQLLSRDSGGHELHLVKASAGSSQPTVRATKAASSSARTSKSAGKRRRAS